MKFSIQESWFSEPETVNAQLLWSGQEHGNLIVEVTEVNSALRWEAFIKLYLSAFFHNMEKQTRYYTNFPFYSLGIEDEKLDN